jgi:hypothetical protein
MRFVSTLIDRDDAVIACASALPAAVAQFRRSGKVMKPRMNANQRELSREAAADSASLGIVGGCRCERSRDKSIRVDSRSFAVAHSCRWRCGVISPNQAAPAKPAGASHFDCKPVGRGLAEPRR